LRWPGRGGAPVGSCGRQSSKTSPSPVPRRASAARRVVPCRASARSRSGVEPRAIEGCTLARALHFDETPRPSITDVHIDLGHGVLGRSPRSEHVDAVDHANHRSRPRTRTRAARPIFPASRHIERASYIARKAPPVMAAVRVPPSACNTSQSTVSVTSPPQARHVDPRSGRERPISRWISWVRPFVRPAPGLPAHPLNAWEEGSMEYSAGDPAHAAASSPGRAALVRCLAATEAASVAKLEDAAGPWRA